LEAKRLKDLSRKVAITGVGETEHARALPGRTGMSLAIEASIKAIDDAGLTKNDVDGVITSEGLGWGNPRGHIELAENLDVYAKKFCTAVPMGGATAGFCIELARWAVATGRCRNVLVVGAGKLGDVARTSVGHGTTDMIASFRGHSPTYEQPFGPTMVTYYASVAARHMFEFGTTSEQLAAIAVAFRKHASLNPDAVMRKPITIQDVVSSRMISSPLHLLDCCISTDGGCAWIVSSAEQARDARHKPVWLLGTGYAQSAYFMGALARGDETHDLVRSVGAEAGKMAFGEAGVRPEEIDVAELYDSFTITALMLLEDLGFCKKGEGGSFVEGGNIELGGKLPVNTHGGLMSCAHFGAGGFLHFVEAVRQLRGECGDRQVKDAKLALAASCAAVVSTHSLAIFGRD
jgi:acetyl-CoA acetyltransferase